MPPLAPPCPLPRHDPSVYITAFLDDDDMMILSPDIIQLWYTTIHVRIYTKKNRDELENPHKPEGKMTRQNIIIYIDVHRKQRSYQSGV